MEKIEIWEVGSGRDNATSLLTAIDSTETEQKLEEILAKSPDMLERGLQLVGRQTLMTGGGYLDLLAVDGDGRLVVFELKRGTLSRDAVAQVIDCVVALGILLVCFVELSLDRVLYTSESGKNQ